MGDLIDFQKYKDKRVAEELNQLQEELNFLIRQQITEEIEQIGFEYYNLDQDEMQGLGLEGAGPAYYVVVSPWIFYMADDEFEE